MNKLSQNRFTSKPMTDIMSVTLFTGFLNTVTAISSVVRATLMGFADTVKGMSWKFLRYNLHEFFTGNENTNIICIQTITRTSLTYLILV